MKKFPEFWYDSNACFGMVQSIEDLEWLISQQIQKNWGMANIDEVLDKSHQNAKGTDDFGSRIEHSGEKTLRQFLVENGMVDVIDELSKHFK